MELLGHILDALQAAVLLALGPFHQATGSWALALLLLATCAQAVIIALHLFAPGRAARQIYSQKYDEIKQQVPDPKSSEFTKRLADLHRTHAPPPWSWSVVLYVILTTLAIRVVGYVGIYRLLSNEPTLRGAPLLWLRDVTQPPARWTLALVLAVLIFLHGFVEGLGVSGVRIEGSRPLSRQTGTTVQRWLWAGTLTVIAAFLPAGLTFYYVSNLLAYAVLVMGIAIGMTQVRRWLGRR